MRGPRPSAADESRCAMERPPAVVTTRTALRSRTAARDVTPAATIHEAAELWASGGGAVWAAAGGGPVCMAQRRGGRARRHGRGCGLAGWALWLSGHVLYC